MRFLALLMMLGILGETRTGGLSGWSVLAGLLVLFVLMRSAERTG
ncbi:hypothetical protein [Paracraurococcus lichenis]|uniref:Uncharacterized protein n=1 Tax=Paracraurococcus lichenis TaxID=3064888 RepID=A0ABT9ECG3_9PROT|nr:hypothetical protein [Paracraurococcus sp. LOR1-02]MDO9713898.1 hypothetical protein [Paracraurococcus sp. LOR1-02]